MMRFLKNSCAACNQLTVHVQHRSGDTTPRTIKQEPCPSSESLAGVHP